MISSVLVIDDNVHVRSMIRDVLQEDGFVVVEAGTLAEGFRRYRETPSAILVVDGELPDGSGLDLIQEVAHEDPRARIVAITGSQGAQLAGFLVNAKVFGAAHTFLKPLVMPEFMAAVRELDASRREAEPGPDRNRRDETGRTGGRDHG